MKVCPTSHLKEPRVTGRSFNHRQVAPANRPVSDRGRWCSLGKGERRGERRRDLQGKFNRVGMTTLRPYCSGLRPVDWPSSGPLLPSFNCRHFLGLKKLSSGDFVCLPTHSCPFALPPVLELILFQGPLV